MKKPANPPNWRREEANKRQILRLHDIGFTMSDIADEIGMKVNAVDQCLKRANAREGVMRIPIDAYENTGKVHSIKYWSEYFDIPLSSCYEVFRKRITPKRKQHQKGVGDPRFITEREFLSGALYTRKGRRLVDKMILRGVILTKKEIRDTMKLK